MEADAKLAAARENVLADEAKLDAFSKAKDDKDAIDEGKRRLEKIEADKKVATKAITILLSRSGLLDINYY
jgi:hypothetical protein